MALLRTINFNKRMNKELQTGQSVVEMLMVLGLVAILVTSIVAGTTRSLISQRRSMDKDTAVKLAQSGMEIIRSLRDTDWDTFRNTTGTWCFSGTSLESVYDEDAFLDCPTRINNKYSRTVRFTWDESKDRMDVLVRVIWRDQSYYYTEISSFFTKWK